MAEPRPMGMRIQRPYHTEDEFIRGDGLTIGRTGMILPNAPPRPPGIIIRFEIVLADGAVALRGEGKVIAHRVHSNGRKGLEVRFTRLDSHSREVIERVLEMRQSGALTPSPPSAQIPDLTPSPDSSRVAPLSAPVVIKVPELRSTPRSDSEEGPQPEPEHEHEPEPQHEHEPEHEQVPASESDGSTVHDQLRVADPPPVGVVAQPPVRIEQVELRSTPRSASDERPLPEPELRSTPRSDSDEGPQPAPAVAPVTPAATPLDEEPIEAPRDEDPTPFAPPAFLMEAEQASASEPSPESEPGQELDRGSPISSTDPRFALDRQSSPELIRAELDKLRDRKKDVAAPSGRDDLLARLRGRRRSG